MELNGKTAFITGGANGLGKGFVEALLERGAKVCFGDIDEKAGSSTLNEFQEKFGAENVRFYQFDVTDHDKFEEVINQVVSAYGYIDIFINNAGIINEGAWLKVIDVNYKALVKGTKLAEAVMRKDKGGKGGRVIQICSLAGLCSMHFFPIYTGTKHAVRAFTSSLAIQPDIEAQGMEYAIICPNAMDTGMVRQIDNTMVNYYDDFKASVGNALMPTSRCVEALLQLLDLEKMNGAILYVGKDSLTYQTVEKKDMGLAYNP